MWAFKLSQHRRRGHSDWYWTSVNKSRVYLCVHFDLLGFDLEFIFRAITLPLNLLARASAHSVSSHCSGLYILGSWPAAVCCPHSRCWCWTSSAWRGSRLVWQLSHRLAFRLVAPLQIWWCMSLPCCFLRFLEEAQTRTIPILLIVRIRELNWRHRKGKLTRRARWTTLWSKKEKKLKQNGGELVKVHLHLKAKVRLCSSLREHTASEASS
jgi:hypothetical protein